MNLHISVPINNTMEFINATEISPLISKCQVKVCYVGQDPNRNGTVITKKVATEMGKKVPGSPVVGYFDQGAKDFEGHNREIAIRSGGKVEIIDTTKPYGFVPTDAKVWFQKFNDEGVEREYLCTECYIWTSAYPESQRVLESGNNQSMELNKETQKGFWSKDNNSGERIFIYNEALIEKLCILGESVEPCFEGAQFKTQFSLENNLEFQEFKKNMFSMLTELQETLNKGGSQETMDEIKKLGNPEDPNFEEKKNPEEEKNAPEDTKPETPNKEKEKKEEPEKKYNLEEVTEYQELLAKYEALQGEYETLKQEKSDLDAQVASLNEFKLSAERKEKQSMIDGFFMLSDEDKKDVVEHIDTYSLDDIEAKLSIICVRNKVSFNLDTDEEKKDEGVNGLFSLETPTDTAPDWIKAVRETAKKL